MAALARGVASELKSGDRVLLEGPMGAGKSTFARALIQALGVTQPAEGSPSFAIAHEYTASGKKIAHIDFYRFRHESELEEAGLDIYFWEVPFIVISEWLSSFPGFQKKVFESVSDPTRIWRVDLDLTERPDLRKVIIRN